MHIELTVQNRNVLFERMDQITKQVAMAGIEKMQKGSKADLLVRYDVGELINKIFAAAHLTDEQKDDEMTKLALYWGQPIPSLYDLRNVATSFTRQFLAEQVEEALGNGTYLTWSHFRELQKVKESKRLSVLKKVRQISLSAKELALELQGRGENQHNRSGGRSPVVPKTPIAMLQKLFTTVQQADNYLLAVQEPLDALFAQDEPVDAKFIENIVTTLERVDMTIENLQKTKEQLSAVRMRAMPSEVPESKKLAAKRNVAEEAPKRKRGRPRRDDDSSAQGQDDF